MQSETEAQVINNNNSAIAPAAATSVQQISEVKWTPGEITILKEAILDAQASNAELALFSKICEATGLNPFAKQIYGIRRKGKITFQCSIDGYRLIADRTGQYAGNDDPLYDEGLSLYQHLISGRGNPLVATVTVWKAVGGVRCNFTASASWEQYAQIFWDKQQNCHKLSETWQKMPHLMLSKCAESLALRKAFPNELSSLRTSDEMSAVEQEPTPTVNLHNPSLALSQRSHPKLSPPEQDATVRSAVEAAIKSLNFKPQQVQIALMANYQKEHLDTLTNYELTQFVQYLNFYATSSEELKKAGWTPAQGQEFLKENFGKKNRVELSLDELIDFVTFLQESN
jgi:phage recombination protein Bet